MDTEQEKEAVSNFPAPSRSSVLFLVTEFPEFEFTVT